MEERWGVDTEVQLQQHVMKSFIPLIPQQSANNLQFIHQQPTCHTFQPFMVTFNVVEHLLD